MPFKSQEQYLDARKKVWQLEEENKKAMRDKMNFSTVFDKVTKDLFKPITKK